jgi:hypothetical protein
MTDQPMSARKLPFSQRYGLAPAPTILSFKVISKELWTDLFNTLQLVCPESTEREDLAQDIWMHFLHKPIGRIPTQDFSGEILAGMVIEQARSDFESEQHQNYFISNPRLYDLVEFVYASQYSHSMRESLQASVNVDLKRDFASVSMIGGFIAPVSDDEQRQAIELAMQGPLPEVGSQLRVALSLLADRDKPNYRDSIKNSISAVESLCRHIVGDSKATLGDALKELKKARVTIHPALEKAFGELYGYAGDKPGIRHALMGVDDLDQEDARYMLVTCSAFVNYLVVKADKAGVKL